MGMVIQDTSDGGISYLLLERRVPQDHPLRPIRAMGETVLRELSPRFTPLYSQTGRPRDLVVTVSEVRISAGAGFVVPITGDIMTMPGLPKHPAAEQIDVDERGRISGLF
jgi:hypothetical protein